MPNSNILNLVSEETFADKMDEKNAILSDIASGLSSTADSEFIENSENPVQSKVIQAALGDKVDKETGKTLSTNDFTAAYKSKLDTVDTTVTQSSTNFVTSDAVYTAVDALRQSPNLTLSKTSVTSISNIATTVTASRSGSGAISAVSSNTSRCTVSVSGTTVTITGGNTAGSATVTVTVAQNGAYKSASKTISVTNKVASSTLSENTPDIIQAVAKSGQASNLWSVGDRTSAITLNGTVSAVTFSNEDYYAFIIGFNHNSSREGNNSIHFMFGYKYMSNLSTKWWGISFVDSKNNSEVDGAYFNMNTTATNSGGWKSSYMRSTVCPAFKNAMPSAWKNIIVSCIKYSDNTGSTSDSASYVTSTSDDIFLLSEYEVLGTRTYANSAEQNYQQQYEYFANGNFVPHNPHDHLGGFTMVWTRSVAKSDYNNYFCAVYYYASAGNPAADHSAIDKANCSLGFSPCFKVA